MIVDFSIRDLTVSDDDKAIEKVPGRSKGPKLRISDLFMNFEKMFRTVIGATLLLLEEIFTVWFLTSCQVNTMTK